MTDANTAGLYLHFEMQADADRRYAKAAARFPLASYMDEAEKYVDGPGSPEFISDVYFATTPWGDSGSDVLHRALLWEIGKYDHREFTFEQWQRDRNWMADMRQEAIKEAAKVFRNQDIEKELQP